MLRIMRLKDGCYRVTLEYTDGNVEVTREWTFKVTESDAEVDESGEFIEIRF